MRSVFDTTEPTREAPMRTLLIATALLSTFAAHAEPKRVSHGPLKPIVLEKTDKKSAAVDPQAYQPKVIEAKPLELATPELDLEIKTKDSAETNLDKKVAKRLSKSAVSDASVMREPVQLKLDEPAPTPAPATSATTANKP
jgi:hypothetical protein